MPSDGGAPEAPSRATVATLRDGLEGLRCFPRPPSGAPNLSLPEVIDRTESTIRGLRQELERLGPWFETFMGSSLVVGVASNAMDEVLQGLDLSLRKLHQPPTTVAALIDRPVHLAAGRLEAVITLLPGHLQLAQRMSERERSLPERVRAMPSRLRRRFYIGLFFGGLFLLSVVIGILLLADPGFSAALGVSALVDKYAPSDAGIVVVALLFITGARLILGSIWLTRTISILPQYEEERVDAAKAGIRESETEVLDRIAPRAEGPDLLAAPGNPTRAPPGPPSPSSELGKHDP